MEVKVTTEGNVFKPFTLNIQITVQTAEDYAELVEESVRFSQDNGVISDSEGNAYPAIMAVTHSLFNSLKQEPVKEGEKSQS